MNPRIIVAKLQSLDIVPQQIKVQLNGDFAVTFKSVAENDSFLASDYVSRSPRYLSHPVWIRVIIKPAELKAGVVLDRIKDFGSILFYREKTIMDTGILSGTLPFKIKLQRQIPSFIYIGPLCLAVQYAGQTSTCRKCDASSHIAKQCVVKDVTTVARLVISTVLAL